jgi:hypothetical protein
MARIAISILLALLQSACVSNAVDRLPAGAEDISASQSVLVFGVGVESKQGDASAFSIQLDEYDLDAQRAVGNCLRYNRAIATVPTDEGRPVQYFAFTVPAGRYASSWFSSGRELDGGPRAFDAPAGGVVYAGDFVSAPSRLVVMRSNLETARSALAATNPGLAKRLAPATATPVKNAPGVLCSM